MACCPQCRGIESLFDEKTAKKELRTYQKKGPGKTTRMLLNALKDAGVAQKSLLDIGGGVGVIQLELLKAGVTKVINVDASTAYIETARKEAQQQGHADKVSYHYGDFVELAPDISAVDIVTLDRTICCYHNMPALVAASSEKAQHFYGVVYPRDTWWVKLGQLAGNLGLWLLRNPYRIFIHPTSEVEALLHRHGFKRQFYAKTLIWQVVLYAR